jgi:RimJ/RimL family protein N-acetyltransferase
MTEDAQHLPQLLRAGCLVLRPHQVDDADAIAAAIAESVGELRPWMPWASATEASEADFQRGRLIDDLPRWGKRGHEATYVIEDEALRLLGVCGIQDRGMPDARELGYWVRTSATGQGYATAAAQALTQAALRLPGVHRVEIRCDAANVRSAAVAERCGYRLDCTEPHEAQAPGHTGTFMVWVRDLAE